MPHPPPFLFSPGHALGTAWPGVAAALAGGHPRADGAPARLRERLRAQFDVPPLPPLPRPRPRRAGEEALEYERYLGDLGYGLAVEHIRAAGVPSSALFLEIRFPDGGEAPPAGAAPTAERSESSA